MSHEFEAEAPVDAGDLLYPRICRAVHETPWALRAETLSVITDMLAFRAMGGRLTRAEIRERVGAAKGSAQVGAARSGAVAVIPVHGVITRRADFFNESSGMAALERVQGRFREAMADDTVGSILLHFDSPGGAVDGVPELADEIFAARGKKRVVALADTMSASAAYWLASAAEEIVVTPSGEIGSIGVYSAHVDLSGAEKAMGRKTTLISAGKFKVEGNPFEPLTEDARAAIQARVDDYYGMFVKAVAKGRGVGVGDVKGGFGEGRIVGAKDAVAQNMADRVDTLDGTLSRLRSGRSSPRRSAAARRLAFL